jgi:hypothetical protein
MSCLSSCLQYADEPLEVLTVDDSGGRLTGTVKVLGPAQASLPAPSPENLLRLPRVTPGMALDAAICAVDSRIARAPGQSATHAARRQASGKSVREAVGVPL